MPTTPEERLTEAARARRRAEHPIPETPRVRIRVHVPPRPRTWTLDPILARSLLALAVGITLIALGALLA